MKTSVKFTTALAAAALALILAPGRALAGRPLGVDVSSYQGGSINWTSVKDYGIVFAWAKATEGTGVIDGDFTKNENNGKAAGVYMGAYHFPYPDVFAQGSPSGSIVNHIYWTTSGWSSWSSLGAVGTGAPVVCSYVSNYLNVFATERTMLCGRNITPHQDGRRTGHHWAVR